MGRLLPVMAVLVRSGCAAAVCADPRKVTRAGITPPLATLLPGAPADAAADCVMQGLTQIELVSLPNSGTLDGGPKAMDFVQGVLRRPDVAACVNARPAVTA